MRPWWPASLLLLGACGPLPPMRHRIEAGEDPYVVFVADAPDGRWPTVTSGPSVVLSTTTSGETTPHGMPFSW